MADRQFVIGGVEAAPADWILPAALEIIPKTAFASFDGTSAAGPFLPCLEIISDSGHVAGLYVTETEVAAGGSAIVSWFPGGGLEEQATTPAAGGTVSSIVSPASSLLVTNANGPTVGVDLVASGVAAGTYGDSTHTAQVTVNADGVVTSATSVGISGLAGTGLTLLYDSTLGGAAASIDTGANAIAAGHVGLIIYVYVRTTRAAFSDNFQLRFNNDSGANYDFQQLLGSAAIASASAGAAQTSALGTCPSASATANVFGVARMDVFNYDGGSGFKPYLLNTADPQEDTSHPATEQWGGQWRSASAISRVALSSATGSNLVAGSRMTIFGVQ